MRDKAKHSKKMEFSTVNSTSIASHGQQVVKMLYKKVDNMINNIIINNK